MSEFPVLYGEATTGKAKMWSIRVFERSGHGVIETSHGYVGGKTQTNEKVISDGKNIGKKNETTPLQQAINEAKSAWQKKKDSGYSPEDCGEDDADSVEDTGRAKEVFDVPNAMLAHDYNKRGKDIKFPCFVQRKYDGTRCIAISGTGLFSRNRKRYPHLDHIVEEINKLPVGTTLDGELYSDKLTFQEIVGHVKREIMKKGDAEEQLKIKFHVYDMISDGMTYEQRYTNLQLIFRKYKFKYLEIVKTDICNSVDHMKELHSNYVAEGYEGIMLRNKTGLYSGTRCKDLQKYKEFFDEEYEIVGYEEGKGLEEGCVLWKCKTGDGNVFSCRPRGTREERQDMFSNGGNYIGKMLTVRYQEMTSSDAKVPRFPIGIAIRDYE